jgi:hypothetical protein
LRRCECDEFRKQDERRNNACLIPLPGNSSLMIALINLSKSTHVVCVRGQRPASLHCSNNLVLLQSTNRWNSSSTTTIPGSSRTSRILLHNQIRKSRSGPRWSIVNQQLAWCRITFSLSRWYLRIHNNRSIVDLHRVIFPGEQITSVQRFGASRYTKNLWGCVGESVDPGVSRFHAVASQ